MAVLLAACGGGATDTAGGVVVTNSTPQSSAKYTPAVSAQPLAAAVVPDGARAVSQTVSAATGASLTATGPDGTTYTLTVPADALGADLTITLTPVARFTSLPFNGSDTAEAWGVQLAPAGQHFLKPLNLRIAPPPGTTLPLVEQLPFSWGEGGAGVALAMLDPASSAIDLKLMHFSGWAIARHRLGLSASLSGLRDRLGGDATARLESAMAERLAAVRQQQQAGSTDGGALNAEELAAYLAEFDRQVIQPRLAAAGQSCANSRLAQETLAMSARGHQLLGLADPNADAMASLLWPGANLCMAEEYTKCHDFHIVQDIIPAALTIMRQAQLLGQESTTDYIDWKARANQQIEACHVYRLDVASSARQTSSEWVYRQDMEGSVTLRSSAAPLDNVLDAHISGDGLLHPTSMSVSYSDGCQAVEVTAPATSMLHVLSLVPRKAEGGGLGDFELSAGADVDASTHTIRDCSLPPHFFVNPGFTWAGTFELSVFGDPSFAGTGSTINHWTIHQGSASIASRTINPISAFGPITFSAPTTFTLVHTPGG
jgi:hypothetical protein